MNVRSAFPLFLTTLLLSSCAMGGEADPSTYTALGEALPEIDFTTVEGVRITNESLKGHVVVLNFFATWCGPCREELPHLEKDVWQTYRRKDFKFIAVGREHTAAEMNAFRDETGFSFPLAADPKRETYSLFAEKWIPRTYVIDRDGTILFQSRGFEADEFDQMISVIDAALKKDAIPGEKPSKSTESAKTVKSTGIKSVTISGETRIRVQHRDR